MIINALTEEHWPSVRDIYTEGITTNNATFETSCPEWEVWNDTHLDHSRWVAEIDGEVGGWIALTPVSDRCVYGGVAEVSVYVGENFRGQGLGKQLIKKAIESSEQNGIWTLTAATFPENVGSIQLHKSCGFREIGFREKIGQLKGQWRDTVLMERRSPKF